MDLQIFTAAIEKWIMCNNLNLSLSGTARIYDGHHVTWSASLIWIEGLVIPQPTDSNVERARSKFQSLALENFKYSNLQLITLNTHSNTLGSRWQVVWKHSEIA